jgi:2,3-dihydroxy-p-cumate/2,3-dihydroxybenzoate 3,4-dioxygenase
VSSSERSGRPLAPDRFGYIRLRVPELGPAIRYYERYVGLELVQCSDKVAMLRAGTAHHSIELWEAPGLERAEPVSLGWVTDDPATLADLMARCQAAQLAIQPLPDHAKGFCLDGFAIEDPNGLTWEIVTCFYEFAEPPLTAVQPVQIMHPFLITDHYELSLHIARDILGFQVSDYVADFTAFLRGENRYHHALALLKGTEFSIEHVNFLMPSFDHLMRARARILYEKIPVKTDLVKHSASQTIAFYFSEPRHGPPVELSYGHRRFDPEDHEIHRPRHMVTGARTEMDMWRASDEDWGET